MLLKNNFDDYFDDDLERLDIICNLEKANIDSLSKEELDDLNKKLLKFNIPNDKIILKG